MPRPIYALLVGINKYAGGVPNLNGCVNDITAVREYLENRVDRSSDFVLKLTLLQDGDATRKAVMAGCLERPSSQRFPTICKYVYLPDRFCRKNMATSLREPP